MANKKVIKSMAVLLFALLSCSVSVTNADELTDRAKTLLDQGKSGEAFKLLDSVEAEREGDVDFDLLFGILAIDSGQNTRGVFALERVLAVQPNNARARAEIARAYLALGETKTAKQEFETVQKQGVSPEVSVIINRYLDAVDRLDTVSRTTIRGYLEGSAGYDTNVNVGPNRNSVDMAIPGIGVLPFILSNSSKANEAWFATMGGGLNVQTPINSNVAIVGGVSGVLRNNYGSNVGQFDSLVGDAYAGVMVTQDKNVFSLNAQFNQYELASNTYRTASGLSGQWQYNHDARNQFSAFAQYSDLRYQTQQIRNAERWVAGGAFAHAYRGGEVVYASAYLVNERQREATMPWLALNGFGVRLGGQVNYNANTVLFANGSAEHRRYGADDPLIQTTRKDTQVDLALGANYMPARYWKITPKLSWTSNESNGDLYKYHRELVSVTVRRDF
ncbi:MAG: surface lipoprotein assembly modifier [Betaproteobacteria bacterium]